MGRPCRPIILTDTELAHANPLLVSEPRDLMTESPVRPFGGLSVWAPTGTEAAAFDRRVIDDGSVPQAALMECAGRSAAQVVDRLYPEGHVVAVVGAGNNGGDALVLLRTLQSWGRSVAAVYVAERPSPEVLFHGWEVTRASDGWDSESAAARQLEVALADADVIVDGILGTGIKGPPGPRQALAIECVNRAGKPVVALDTPSGVDADTGQVPSEAVVAQVTIALGWPKLGTLLQPGRASGGRLVAVEIGFPPVDEEGFGAMVVTPSWVSARRPQREPHAHKNQVGALLLVAGESGMAGAAVMAGRAALRAGVGLLRVVSAAENREIIQTSIPEAVFIPEDDPVAVREAAGASNAVAAGPGLGQAPQANALLELVLDASAGIPAVLDADALNLAASGSGPALQQWSEGRDVLITPHIGEMRNLSGQMAEAIAADRITAARTLAEESRASVLLKGLPSVVAHGGGPCWVDATGSSDLSAGGMGDVLTGVAGGYLAQGVTSDVAGALALYVTGRAAACAGKGASLTPSDVIETLPRVMDEQGPGRSDLDLPFVLFDQDAAR